MLHLKMCASDAPRYCYVLKANRQPQRSARAVSGIPLCEVTVCVMTSFIQDFECPSKEETIVSGDHHAESST